MPFRSGRKAVARGRVLVSLANVVGAIGIVGGLVIFGAFLHGLRTPIPLANATDAPVTRATASEALPPPAIELRRWKDISGRFETEALFQEAWGETVYLKRNGKTIAVPFTRLCVPDRNYVRQVFPVQVIHGAVVSLADGDTISVLDGAKTQHKIRLEGIDAPESNQAFGTQAKKLLADLVFQKNVEVEWREKDKYDRILGHVFIDGEWINGKLINDGLAWHYKEYNQNGVLAAAETKAKEAKLGLWAEKSAMAPWEFRHKPAAPRPPPSVPSYSFASSPPAQPVEQTVYITSTGAKYHTAGCRHLRQSSSAISLRQAAASYGPCAHCHPPTLASSSINYARPSTSYSPPSYSSTGDYTATGIPIHTGPRGGRYHYSKSGKKVYERRR